MATVTKAVFAHVTGYFAAFEWNKLSQLEQKLILTKINGKRIIPSSKSSQDAALKREPYFADF